MGIYFVGDLYGVRQQALRCVFCERPFESKRILDEHYLAAHRAAFTEEELVTAGARHTTAPLQGLKRSPISEDT